uniref:Uncharacterized protein n=1 Tax=Arcella intermedia TaxID=1963864 RepID=A0A6B2LJ64_9EUKA
MGESFTRELRCFWLLRTWWKTSRGSKEGKRASASWREGMSHSTREHSRSAFRRDRRVPSESALPGRREAERGPPGGCRKCTGEEVSRRRDCARGRRFGGSLKSRRMILRTSSGATWRASSWRTFAASSCASKERAWKQQQEGSAKKLAVLLRSASERSWWAQWWMRWWGSWKAVSR